MNPALDEGSHISSSSSSDSDDDFQTSLVEYYVMKQAILSQMISNKNFRIAYLQRQQDAENAREMRLKRKRSQQKKKPTPPNRRCRASRAPNWKNGVKHSVAAIEIESADKESSKFIETNKNGGESSIIRPHSDTMSGDEK